MTQISSGLYKVTLRQIYTAQIVFNVFWFVENVGLDDKQQECLDAFNEDLLPVLDNYQINTLDYDEVIVDNVTGDLAPLVGVPAVASGSASGTELPSFVALAVKLNRTTKETRNGAKRICGQLEENVTGNFFDTAYSATFPALETALGSDITTVGGIFHPVIVRPPVAPSVLWTTNDVLSAIANRQITTQNSRKLGVGI